MYLRCGLYHGGDALCDACTTRPESEHLESCHWNENLEFQLKVCDIPRSAKLCYVLYSSRDAQAKKKKRAAQKEVCRNAGDGVLDQGEHARDCNGKPVPAAAPCYILPLLYWWECAAAGGAARVVAATLSAWFTGCGKFFIVPITFPCHFSKWARMWKATV